MSIKEFYSVWKQASFGWIPKKYYFDLKIVAFFAMYAIVLQYQNPTRIFFVMFKLVGFTLLWNLFKKWFKLASPVLSQLAAQGGVPLPKVSGSDAERMTMLDFPHPEINPFEETLTPLQKILMRDIKNREEIEGRR